jgi:hypothetical protein
LIDIRRADDPAAWLADDIGGKQGLLRPLSGDERAAIDRFLAAHADSIPESITRDSIDEPLIVALGEEVNAAVTTGRGATVLSGFDIARHGMDGFKRLYWAIGTFLGEAVEQSYRRDRIGYVQKEKDNPTGRGYLMDVELRPHTDFHEILSLATVSQAEEGGISGIVSSLAIHDIILAERPDLLPALYEGFYHESGGGSISDEKVPVFARVDGKLSCYYHLPFVHRAAKQMGVALPPALVEATAFMGEVSRRPGVIARFLLEPGEMLFWHNFLALHARDAFTDTDAHTRLLLRLWINARDSRPMPEVFHRRARQMDAMHAAGEAAIDYAAAKAA